MNIFEVLGVRYEVFFSRMLLWLWNIEGDHKGGDVFWKPIHDFLRLPNEDKMIEITDEVKTPNSASNRWRLADLVVQTKTKLILVENKIDPLYQDLQQVRDEVQGGQILAQNANKDFVFLYIAPGPLATDVAAEIDNLNGVFVSWATLIDWFKSVQIDELQVDVVAIVQQFLDYAEAIVKSGSKQFANDPWLKEAESAIATLLNDYQIGESLTAADLWSKFLQEFPDHVSSLDSRYADSSHYSAKSWFSAKLQRMATNQNLIEETGNWTSDIPSDWGFNKVRVYRRLPAAI